MNYNFVEDFEDNDISYYTANNGSSRYYEGGSETVTSDVSFRGSNSLRISLNGENGQRALSTNSLNQQPSRGDTFEYYVYAGNSNVRRAGVKFATDDPTDGASRGYLIQNNFSESKFRLFSLHSDASSSVTWNPPVQEWIKVVVEFGASEIVATAYDSSETQIGQNTITDSQYDTGWWSWYGNTNSNSSGGSVYYDNLRIKLS